MAIALRGSAAVPGGNPTTGFTVTVDAAVATDDLLFITITSRDSTSGSSDVTVTDNDTGGNTWAVVTNTSDKKAWVFWKRATSGTASKTVTVANCVGSASGVLKAFSGADTGATPYSNQAVNAFASGTETASGITPDVADSMLCFSVHNLDNDHAVTSLSSANFGAMTVTEKLSTGGSDCATAFGHDLVTSGATGDITWAQTNGATKGAIWAIKPAAVPPAFDQDSYRFRNDDGSETGATWLAALNTNVTVEPGSTIRRLRMLVQNTASGAGTDVDLEWQYNKNSAGWNNITTSSSVVQAVASANFANGDDCTQQLGSGTFHSNNDGMTEDGTAGGANLDLAGNAEVETELSFQILSADVVDGDTIQFRLTRDGGTVLDTYTRTPQATVSVPARAQVSWIVFEVPEAGAPPTVSIPVLMAHYRRRRVA